MSIPQISFLLVDDDRADRGLVKRYLTKEFQDPIIREAETREQFLQEIQNPPNIIISDYLLRGFTGLEVLEILKQKNLETPVILLTGTGNEEIAIEAMKMGVADYVIKTIEHIKRLPATVDQVLRLNKIEFERRHAKEELLLSDQILNSMPDTVLLTDLDGEIVRWTGSAEVTFGFRSQEVIGESHTIILDPADGPLDSLASPPLSSLPHGLVQQFEAKCRKKDGSTFPAEVTYRTLFDKVGKALGWVMVYRDITERKKMEEILREHTTHLGLLVDQRTQKIEELQRQKSAMEKIAATGQMAARVAHEINNPLAGIKNAFTLIRSEIPKDSKYASYVDLIKKEIDRIAAIIQQMYKTYSPKAGKPNQFDLSGALSDVCRLLSSKSKQNHLEIETSVPKTPILVYQPEGEVNQILYNLILNAIQASHSGDKIRVTVRKYEDDAIVEVADTGEGISQEIQSKIFDPFFTTKKSGGQGGLGLGLAVSQNLAQAMGGAITVASAVNQGATFTFSIPISCNDEPRPKETANV